MVLIGALFSLKIEIKVTNRLSWSTYLLYTGEFIANHKIIIEISNILFKWVSFFYDNV